MAGAKSFRERIVELQSPDVQRPGSRKDRRSRRRRIGGWKRTLYFGAIWACTILTLNLVMVIWASTRRLPEGSSVLYAGDCSRTKQISSGVHVLINIMSTGVLGASHFAMQCLSAPAREDVDRAHAEKRWLDIGVPSMRNLFRIPRMRRWMWLGLVASSVPLHLFYNSTVYSTISVNSYNVFVGNSSIGSLGSSNVRIVHDDRYSSSWEANSEEVSSQRMLASAHANNLTRLSPLDCITAYATSWQSKYAGVTLISSAFDGSDSDANSDSNSMSPLHIVVQQLAPRPADSQQDPYGWICQSAPNMPVTNRRCQSDLQTVKQKADSAEGWVVDGYKIDYCLVEETPEKCTLEYSLALSIVVIAMNVVKIGIVLLTIGILRANPLLTLGDAIASFLRVPDESSRGVPLLTKEVVVKKGLPGFRDEIPKSFNPHPTRRWTSVSLERWAFSSFMYISSVILAFILLIYGLAKIKAPKQDLWTSGFATIDTRTMISTYYWPTSLTTNSLVANLPHLIFSSLYFLTNSILTTMAISTEWSSFAVKRTGLRVSTPAKGEQRRARFLSLPRRYSLPLLGVSGVLHWLMSQSIFLVRVLARDSFQGRDPSRDTTTVGYSPPAIVTGLCVGVLLPMGVVGIAVRLFKSGMPVVGSCSFAIAAGCHPRGAFEKDTSSTYDVGSDGDEKLGVECKMLQWGVEAGTADCAFSASLVFAPG
ncbi:hypothetical protein BJX70DRAFT_405924 [Aspergillus crustosus]